MKELRYLLLKGPTQMLRLWFGLTSCFFAIYLLSGTASINPEYTLTFQFLSPKIWALMLILTGASLLYGVITSRYSKIGLFLEGILGTAVWSSLGITSMISQGSVGGVTVALAMNIFLLIRYPTWQENL